MRSKITLAERQAAMREAKHKWRHGSGSIVSEAQHRAKVRQLARYEQNISDEMLRTPRS